MRVASSRLAAVLATLGMLTVAVCGVRLSEAGTDAEIIRGSLGDSLSVRDGVVSVTQVRAGTALRTFGRTEATPGLFVVVKIDGRAPGRRELKLGTLALLTAAGVTYRPYSTTAGLSVPPGFAQTVEVAFEVDPGRLAELTLSLQPSEIVSGYSQDAQISLGITATNAAAWAAAGRGAVLQLADDELRGLP